jgi:hypothetical protein
LLADHFALGQILTDGACSAVVAVLTMVGRRDETEVPIFKRIAVGKATNFRTANWSNKWVMMQSEELMQPLPENGQPAHRNGEKPSKQRFAKSAHH